MPEQLVPADWRDTFDRFRQLGLTNSDFRRAMELAKERNARNLWAYTCGILWSWVDSPTPIFTRGRL